MQYFGLWSMSVIVVTFLFKGTETVQITPLRRTLACASCLQCFALLLGHQEGLPACKNGGWWRWALVSPDGVALGRMLGVSASVNPPLDHEVQKFYSGTGLPGWSRKKGRKTVVVMVVW